MLVLSKYKKIKKPLTTWVTSGWKSCHACTYNKDVKDKVIWKRYADNLKIYIKWINLGTI